LGSQILLLPQSFSDGLFFLPFRNVALVRKGSNRAAELLNETSTIELGTPNSYVLLVPVYLRGEAYLALGDGQRARQNFRIP